MTVVQRAESLPERERAALPGEPAEQSLPALLLRNAERHAARPAFREKRSGIWRSWSWAEARDEIVALALGLQALGLGPDARLALLGCNNPRLYWSMLAAQMLGAVPVPLHPDSTPAEAEALLRASGAGFAIAEDQEQVDKLLAMRTRLPDLRQVVFVSARGLRDYDRDTLHAFDEVLHAGRSAGSGAALVRAAAETARTAPCILFHDGDGGDGEAPRPVLLSHGTVIARATAAAAVDRLGPQDSVLGTLPLCWIGDFMVSVAQALVCGFCTACAEGEETAPADMRELGPSYMLARPQDFDAIRARVDLRIADAGRLQRWLHSRAMAAAERALAEGRRPSLFWSLLILAPLRDALGLSRLRHAYAAGGALTPETLLWFRALGVNLKQAYGQTEAALFLALHRDGAVRPGTVGEALPGVELRIAGDGAVEYRLSEIASEAAQSAEDWRRSGDAGRFDAGSGQLVILDRAADLGRLGDGGLFAPGAVENRLTAQPHILYAVVLGDGRPFCTALLNIDPEAVGKWAEREEIVTTSYQELAGHPRVHDLLRQEVEAVNRSLSADADLAGCRVRRFLVLHKELDADDGELTRLGQLRRDAIAARYAPLVEALYGEARSVHAEIEVSYEDGSGGSLAATLEIRDTAEDAPAPHGRAA
ncbi:AMP-binding protein [Marinibaculum pumilum]|uniref:AMP-binding protein n=1 Tax=Marinibaculum pumilum TaxID=1766165 RepID=A0ABV7L2L2_9PROT